MSSRQHQRRHLRATPQVAQLRHATLEGRSHLVCPVVALVGDSVLTPMGATGREYIPANVLAVSVGQWDGRAVVPVHPMSHGGQPTSANTPANLEGLSFGRLFATRFERGRLMTEAWLHVDKAAALGGAAQWAVDEVKAGRMVEVSIGATVAVDLTPGISPAGEPYDSRWVAVYADHLAFGLNGAEGACSIADGCGALRAATSHHHTSTGDPTMTTPTCNCANCQETRQAEAQLNALLNPPDGYQLNLPTPPPAPTDSLDVTTLDPSGDYDYLINPPDGYSIEQLQSNTRR